ncbi:MAG: hypothetical protein Q9186_006071 [Xanthomendoza sp. 1 TL-2023]
MGKRSDHHRQHVQTISFPFALLDLHFSPNREELFVVATSIGTVIAGYFTPAGQRCGTIVPTDFSISMAANPIVVTTPNVPITSLAFATSSLDSPPVTLTAREPGMISSTAATSTDPHQETTAPISASSSLQKVMEDHRKPLEIIAVTMADGSVGILHLEAPLIRSVQPLAHPSMEAWVVAWSQDSEIPSLYTGGDDSALVRHRVRQNTADAFNIPPSQDMVFKRDIKIHGAGVTAIVPLGMDLLHRREVILTGSYDEYIRVLFVVHGSTKVEVAAEKRLGGGVWQLKPIERPEDPTTVAGYRFAVLASCMHAGCKILEVGCDINSQWEIEILAEFEDHESMNYASDFQVKPDGQRSYQENTYVSTSFYDKKLCVWKVEGDSTAV